MESSDSHVEPEKRLADLEEGDVVVLTLEPERKFLGKSAVEKTARITLKLSHAIIVGDRRFSISSGKELYQVSGGQWRVMQDGYFISVPTAEQLERLPDPDGNYTDSQIRAMREKTIEAMVDAVREHLDLGSDEFDQRAFTLQFSLVHEELKKTLVWVQEERIKRLENENEDLKSKLRQLSILFDTGQTLVRHCNLEPRS